MDRRVARFLVAVIWLLIVTVGIGALALATLGVTWSLALGGSITGVLAVLFLCMWVIWFLWW